MDTHSVNTMRSSAVLNFLVGKASDRPPRWFMRQAGRYLPEYQKTRAKFASFLDMCRDPEAPTELALQPIARFDLNAAILFSDILTIADAVGLGVEFTDQGPIMQRPICHDGDIHQLNHHDHAMAALDYVFQATATTKAALPAHIPLIGFSAGPWTLYQYCIGPADNHHPHHHAALRWYMAHPLAYATLQQRLTTLNIDYLDQQIQHGADAIFIIDTHAGILPAHLYQDACGQYTQQLTHTLKARHPNTPIIFYHRQNQVAINHFQHWAIDAVVCDWTTHLPTIRQQYPSLPIMGNYNPNALLIENIKQRDILTSQHHQQLANDHAFAPTLGHGILPNTPVTHVQHWLDSIEQHHLNKGR